MACILPTHYFFDGTPLGFRVNYLQPVFCAHILKYFDGTPLAYSPLFNHLTNYGLYCAHTHTQICLWHTISVLVVTFLMSHH
jgi:hypothetical protein